MRRRNFDESPRMRSLLSRYAPRRQNPPREQNRRDSSMDHSPALQPDRQQCSTCIEAKKPSEMPGQVSPRCKHQPTVCKDCLKNWLRSSIEGGAWDRLKCPDCSEQLEWQDIRRHASDETFTRYDSLVLRAALSEDPAFHFCLSPTCGSGQLHEAKCPRFECVACAAFSCLEHNMPWHWGETCEEYDERNRGLREAEQASEEAVRELSRPCPKCKRDVYKYAGCNHITCICGHEWCYLCAGAWQRTPSGVLFSCDHAPACTEDDEAVQDAFNELDRGLAWEDFLPPLVAAEEQVEAAWDALMRIAAEVMRDRGL